MEENLQVYSNLNFLAPEQVAAISGSTAAKIDEYIGGCNLNKDELSSDLEKRSVELGGFGGYKLVVALNCSNIFPGCKALQCLFVCRFVGS